MLTTRRKILRKLARDILYSLDHARFEIAPPEIRFHVAADFCPTLAANMRIDAAVGNNLDPVVGKQQVDQDTIVVRGIPNAQMREDIERALARRLVAKQGRSVEGAFSDKAHLAGMRGLAGLYS